jgi:hypothetical protein
MYYTVKLRWKEPKEGTDEMLKISKQFLVSALSLSEAEIKFAAWIPANYQDPNVEEVKQTKIVNLDTVGAAEQYWLVKLLDDADGRSRPQSYLVVLNGINLDEINRKLKTNYTMQDIESVQKFKPIIDDDLTSMPKEKEDEK